MTKHSNDVSAAGDMNGANVALNKSLLEGGNVIGKFHCECRDKDGNLKWTEDFDNLITTAGKRWMLDAIAAANGYTAIHMGLISGSGSGYSYTGPVIADTMASHAGWQEVAASGTVNTPNVAARLAPSFSAAALGTTEVNKATSAAVAYTIITNAGTVKGAFIVINGTSAIANTTGTLFSAGAFSGGDKVVAVSDTLNVSYTATLT
jgi:hypothetical protein